MPNTQLSAFADTKIPLKQTPSSCSTFNHFCDTKILQEEASNMRATDRKCWECDGDAVGVCCPGLEQVVSSLYGNIVTFSHFLCFLKVTICKRNPCTLFQTIGKDKENPGKGSSSWCSDACWSILWVQESLHYPNALGVELLWDLRLGKSRHLLAPVKICNEQAQQISSAHCLPLHPLQYQLVSAPLDFTTWCSTLHLLSLCALNVLRHLNVTL